MAIASVAALRRIADAHAPWCVTVYGTADAWLRSSHPTEAAHAQIHAPPSAPFAMRTLLPTSWMACGNSSRK